MQFKKFFVTAVTAMAWSASAAPEPKPAMAHGAYTEHNGRMFRYHQLARDVFTGVPADEWDDTVHQRSDEVWDLNGLAARGLDGDDFNGSLSRLDDRNIANTCRLAWTCTKEYGRATVELGWYLWLVAANKAEKTGLIDFLKTPFFANAGGVAIAGIISANVNGQAHPKAASCSTANTEVDVVSAAIAAAVKANPMATQLTVEIDGPDGASWSITISAAPAGQTPKAVCQ